MINPRKNAPIVRANDPIGLFGGGHIGKNDLADALIRVESAVAVDSGATALVESGRMPDAVIGDFDSLDSKTRQQIPSDRLFQIAEQDSTDFDKALRSVEAPIALGVGFLGGRLDHQLAALNTLVSRPDCPCILLGEHEIVFHAPPKVTFSANPGEIVSLFPLQRVTGDSQGLEWPIKNLVFEPLKQIGTSNRVVSDVVLQMDGPGLVVMAPRAALDQVMQAFLSGQTGRWPAHAE